MFTLPDAGKDTIVAAFRNAPWVSARPAANDDLTDLDAATIDVLSRLAKLAPLLNIVPTHIQDEHTLEWHWARMRCILAGPGYKYHAPLATILCGIYPQCPLLPNETFDEWYDAALKARGCCGWPLSFANAPWQAVAAAVPAEEDAIVESWHFAFAMLHLLKHTRLRANGGPVVTFRSSCITFEPATRGNATFATIDIPGAVRALGGTVPGSRAKTVHPLSVALRHWLTTLTTRDYLRRKSCAVLSPQVLWGAWSTTAPDPTRGGWIQHGLTLDGVCIASGGVVHQARDVDLADDDVIGYDWATGIINEEDAKARVAFERAVPATYDATIWPSALISETAPHIVWKDSHHASLLDALLVCAVLRGDVPSLANEKPILVVLPEHPTPSDSTKQGKSALAHAIIRSIALDLPLKIVSANSSAPDQRSIVDGILRRGTIYLDEWKLDTNPAAFLNKDNIQTMTVGGSANGGKVLQNDEINVTLRQFMAISAKAYHVPPDMVNRVFPFIFLENLTDEQFDNGPAYDQLVSGQLSIRIRLAALAMAERHGLAAYLNGHVPSGTRTGTRFLRHRAMAGKIIELKTGCTPAQGLIVADGACAANWAAHAHHESEADASGLLAMLDAGVITQARVSSVFSDLDDGQCKYMQTAIKIITAGSTFGASPMQLLRARASAAGMENRPLSELFRYLAGPGPLSRMSDRALGLTIAKELRNTLPEPGTKYPLPDMAGLHGWCLHRKPDYGNTSMYELINVMPGHSHNKMKQPLETPKE
jgi:hypothetical protein